MGTRLEVRGAACGPGVASAYRDVQYDCIRTDRLIVVLSQEKPDDEDYFILVLRPGQQLADQDAGYEDSFCFHARWPEETGHSMTSLVQRCDVPASWVCDEENPIYGWVEYG